MFDMDIRKSRRVRSTIVRGGYSYRESEPERPGGEMEETTPAGKGRVSLSRDPLRGKVALEYDPAGYVKERVETFEELRERFRIELDAVRAQLKRAEEKIIEVEAAAREEGKKEGFEEGMAAGRREVEAEMEKLVDLLKSANEQTKKYFLRVEDRLADFAMQIARRVVGEAARLDRSIAVALAREAVRMAVDRSRIVLICNPDDYEELKEARADLKVISEGIKEIEIETSVNVSPGGVILETVSGSIDATMETMLDEVHKALKPEYEQGIGGGEGQ